MFWLHLYLVLDRFSCLGKRPITTQFKTKLQLHVLDQFILRPLLAVKEGGVRGVQILQNHTECTYKHCTE